jgi:hypothetical protein
MKKEDFFEKYFYSFRVRRTTAIYNITKKKESYLIFCVVYIDLDIHTEDNILK